jgi:predicted nucleic acid-binding protein
MSVLLDTGLIFAYLNRQDAGHREARALMLRIARKEFGAPFVSDHVIDELFVLIRVRTGSAALEEAAHRFLPLPSPALKGLAAVSLGTGLLGPTWEVFRKYRDQGISFTDASLIVTMREMGIERLATLDSRLGKLVPFAA